MRKIGMRVERFLLNYFFCLGKESRLLHLYFNVVVSRIFQKECHLRDIVTYFIRLNAIS